MQEVGVYYINLEKNKERLQNLKNQFKNFDKFQRIEAVDGKKLSAFEYFTINENFKNRYFKSISPGEIGCSLSHLKALKTFVKSDKKIAIILEDDINANDEILFEAYEKTKFLGENFLLNFYKQKLKISKYFYGKEISQNLFEISGLTKKFLNSTLAYVCDKTCAKEIIKNQEEILKMADWWSENLKIAKIYYSPLVSTDETLISEIELDRKHLKINKTSKILKFLSFKIKKHFLKFILPFSCVYYKILGYKKI